MQRTSWSLLIASVGGLVIGLALMTTSTAGADPVVATNPTTTIAPPATPPATTTLSNADVVPLGDAASVGSTGVLNQPIIGMAASPSGNGYWVVARDGGIFAFGDAHYYGSTGGIALNQPIVAMAPTPDGGGYWFVAADGGVFTFGDAAFKGSTGAVHLNQPIVGMAPTPTGNGYWLVARDGGIFTFGDAPFFGSTGNVRLNKPIVGMAALPSGLGYWFVAADGGIFSFGTADFHGSTADLPISGTISGMSSTPDGQGYWMTTSGGTVYNFGDAVAAGGIVGALSKPVVGIVSSPTGHGYWLATSAPESIQASSAGTGPPVGPSPLVHNLRILYTDNESGNLLTANTDGSFRHVIPTLFQPSGASLSPNGSKVAGELDTGNGQLVIAVQAIDGTNQQALTQASTTYIDVWPAWSHDGQRIAWIRSAEPATVARVHTAAVDQAQTGLWLMNADGSGQTLVANTSDATGPLSWSPDGSRIAFTACSPSTEGCTTSVVAISTDGTKRQTLVAGQDPADPVWSPDGTEIAYDQAGSLYQIHPDGTGLGKLLDSTAVTPPNSSVSLTPAAWYPDGSQLIVDTNEVDTNGLTLNQILIIAKDGQSGRRFPVRAESTALGVAA